MCGSHIGSRALVGKTFRQGFYWPTALQDAVELVTKCEACQFHSKNIHLPAQALQKTPLSWPFSVWGLDILGPFPRAIGGFEFLFVAIDKFTKWPEVTAVRKVNAQSAIKFLKELVCRFGVWQGSLPTTAPSSRVAPSCTMFMPSDARYHLPLWQTPEEMDKLRGRTLKCYMDSRQELSIRYRSTASSGSRSCR